ncbi:MAG: glycosyltransferase family 4 protein [Pseudomonadota bacterium]
MTIAFYAPLKAPGHPVPSGDRAMARALLSALACGGYAVECASDLRLFDGKGDTDTQDALSKKAAAEAQDIIDRAPDWQLWLTYHNYYKAPDLIGPRVSGALNIPYLQIESTRARKRLAGPWARFATAAEAASDAAHTILYFTERDAETLRRDAPKGQVLTHLPPFLDCANVPAPSDLSGPLLTVAMMRKGDKTASYTLLAEALTRVPDSVPWRLDIAGDGENAPEIKDLFAPFGDRIAFLGALDADALADKYAHARALVWPGVNEAFGMVYLEAQAAGVPVIAQDRPAIREIIDTDQPSTAGGPAALAARIAEIWSNDTTARETAAAGRRNIVRTHLRPHATATLRAAIEAAL